MGAVRSIWAMLVATLVLAAAPASAQEPARLALLIGNQGYAAKVGALKNPHTDVALIEAALIKLGFKVVVLKDAGLRAMDTAIKRHVREVNRAGAGALSFFYYSGHGVANPETKVNYLIPVDVTETEDEKIWDEAYQQNAVIDLLSQQAPRATHFVVFDACRNELNITGPAAKSLGADKGFVPIQNTAGLLIAYATAPGKTASDVGSGGGPYATALADELVKPGVEAVSMFRAVQIRVKQAINQDPWLSFPSLPPTFLAGQSAQSATSQSAQSSTDPRGSRDCPQCPELIEVPRGTSMLGVAPGHSRLAPHEALHSFTLDRSLAVSVRLITKSQWNDCQNAGGCPTVHAIPNNAAHDSPATGLSWADAATFSAWLTAKTGRRYRLATSDEQEYISSHLGEKLRDGESVLEWTANCWLEPTLWRWLADVANDGCAFRIVRGKKDPAWTNGARAVARSPEIGFRIVRED